MPLPDILIGSDHTLLRVLHYPPLTGHEEPGAVRAAAHGDINLLTILPGRHRAGVAACWAKTSSGPTCPATSAS